MMNEVITKSIDSFLNVFSELKEYYKNQCSEISLKISALNISNCRNFFDLDKYKDILQKIQFTSNLEYKLIISSLYLCNFDDYENKLDEYYEMYHSKLSMLPSKSIYTYICGLILLSLGDSYESRLDGFVDLYRAIERSYPLLNCFEYSPFILLSSLSNDDKTKIAESSNEIYYSMHDSGFARGTNSYCTSLYLSTLNKNISTDRIRNIYLSLQSEMPLNQFNYLSCAQLYTCDTEFKDYTTIREIYHRIANETGLKWFTEQLDIALAISIYLNCNNLDPLMHIDWDIRECLTSSLLTTMIASTILLNNENS